MPTIIACLSQKGGVGKSTIARLMARTFASAGWTVKICDFNTKQLTSTDWVSVRMSAGYEPAIAAEPMNSTKRMKSEQYDCLVIDGKPDSDQTSLEAARIADMIIIPSGVSLDDMKPQVAFAKELMSKGIDRRRIIWVFNKTTESDVAVREAVDYLALNGLEAAETDLAHKTGYQMAMNIGLSIAETKYPSLNERADQLAVELVEKLNALEEIAA